MSAASSAPPPEGDAAAGEAKGRAYGIGTIMESAKSASPSSLWLSAKYIHTAPCFKPSFLWAAGTGVALAAHRMKEGGSPMQAMKTGVAGGSVIFMAQWYLCRRDEHDRKVAYKAWMAKQAAIQSGELDPADAAAAVGYGGLDGSGGAGDSDFELMPEAERVRPPPAAPVSGGARGGAASGGSGAGMR